MSEKKFSGPDLNPRPPPPPRISNGPCLKKDQKKRLSAFLNDNLKEYESADRDGEDIEIEMEGGNARVVEQRDEGDDAMETEK